MRPYSDPRIMPPRANAKENIIMKHEGGGGPRPVEPSKRDSDDETGPISNRALLVFLAVLAVVLVLGYLFVNKLADISREEDCALAHRRNCGAVELPAGR
jgi:hypothetical protein